MIKKYRNSILCLFIFIFSGVGFSQSNNWMQSAGGAKVDEAYEISTDDSSNTYTTGYFTAIANFGTLSVSTLGVSDIFIAKTDPNGNYKWVEKAGGMGSDRGLAIKTDSKGNSYITGWYYGTATFGTHTINSVGMQDVFIAKYDRNGNCKWAVSAGGREGDIGNDITIDNVGNPIVTGEFMDTAQFGTFSLISTKGHINVFTAKLDSSNGNFIWAKSGTGPHTDRGLGVACDAAGNVYVAGSYSDTITFDTVRLGNIYNAIFLIKYNSAGKEQWFTRAAGSIYGISNAIAVDKNNYIYLTGDFEGVLNFFWKTHTTTLTNPYSNDIFVAKYDKDANLIWEVADGSNNALTARNIALDTAGNAFVIGNFDCKMNGYADKYGQGTFNTVGFWDIFISEYSAGTSGWQWSRQIGGDKNNYGNGIALNKAGNIYVSGSFDTNVTITEGAKFLGYTYDRYSCNPSYCGDPYYGAFATLFTAGNLDIFISEPIDLNRQTYDYYTRSGSGCSKPYEGVCIRGNLPACQDTAQFCISGILYPISNTCPGFMGAGPLFDYKWSTGSTWSSIPVSTSGYYSVTQTSKDGCFKSSDTIYVIIHPKPAKPTISDNVIINTNAIDPKQIVLCRDSIILTGGNYGSNSYYWTDSARRFTTYSSNLSVHAPDSDYFVFVVIDSFGCEMTNKVKVVLDSVLPVIIPKLYCQEDPVDHDTVVLCQGKGFNFLAYDSISNPGHSIYACIPPYDRTIIKWNVTPNTISYAPVYDCRSYYTKDNNYFVPADSGWYIITATIIRVNKCDTDVKIVSDSMFVRLHPNPVINLTVKGNRYVCPGGLDSTQLIATCNYPFKWSTGSTKDSIWAKVGSYYVLCTVTNSFGCTSSKEVSLLVQNTPQPLVTMNPWNGLICPNDSVHLYCTGAGVFQWFGPYGPIPGNINNIYVNIPGYYYCVLTDTNGCVLLSNTVLTEQYTTPYIYATPNTVICPGDSAYIHVAASIGAIIQWQWPLTGHDSVKVITAPGTYTCKVVSCGITTIVSITISMPSPVANIHVYPSPVMCSLNDSVILSGDSGLAFYLWTPGNINSQSITVKSPGTYTLTTYDANGCSATNSVTIKQSSAMFDSVVSFQNVLCYLGNSGSITVGIRGGTAPFTYSWAPSGGSSATASGLTAGSYTVLVTDANGCTSSLTASIAQPLKTLYDSVSFANLWCCNVPGGTATAYPYGVTGNFSYNWNPGGQTTATISGLSAGSYTVIVTDSSGCAVTSSVTLTQPSCLAATIASTNATCRNDNGSATVTVSGGTGTYTYLWSPGGQTTSSISGLSVGIYSVVITDSHGCVDTLSVNVNLTNDMHISISKTADSTCRGDNITFTVTGGITYKWSNGSTSSSITVSADYSPCWVICDSGACVDTIPVKYYCYPPLGHAKHKNDTICLGNSAIIKTIVVGGKKPYTYLWNEGITSDSPGPFTVYPNAGTFYVCTISDQCNYKTTDSSFVYPAPFANVSFEFPTGDIHAGDVVEFTNTSNGASSYLWSFGDGDTSINYSVSHAYAKTGTYLVVLTAYNNSGCKDTSDRYVNVIDKLTLPNVFTPNGDGIDDVFMVKIPGAGCFDCKIYNRWGHLVYEWKDINAGWDGIDLQTNAPAVEGTYYYFINYCNSSDDSSAVKQGIISLIRSRK